MGENETKYTQGHVLVLFDIVENFHFVPYNVMSLTFATSSLKSNEQSEIQIQGAIIL